MFLLRRWILQSTSTRGDKVQNFTPPPWSATPRGGGGPGTLVGEGMYQGITGALALRSQNVTVKLTRGTEASSIKNEKKLVFS